MDCLTPDQLLRAPLEDVINNAWGWNGLVAISVLKTSIFGHIILQDTGGHIWFLDQDMPSLEKIATNKEELLDYFKDPDAANIWTGGVLTQDAIEKLGEPQPGYCYAFERPPILGGEFNAENLTSLPIRERIIFSGDIARQIQDVPDGQEVQIKIVD